MPRVSVFFVAALCAVGASLAGQTLPTGFSDQLLTGGLDQPAGFTFLPDGRIVVVEQRTALVKVFAGGPVGTLGTIPGVNISGNERGLLGVDVDPGWPTRPYLYFHYNHATPQNVRLVRYTVSGDLNNPASTNLSLGSAYAVLTDVPDNAWNHNGGTCRFGTDGMLYVSLGDDASSCTAQDISDLRGVILRLDVSNLPAQGSGPPAKSTLVPAGNPFAGPNDNARLTWAYGLRNPFRFNVDPVTGRLYIGDVGQRAIEELDESRGGENYGWPWREGPSSFLSCGGTEPPSVAPIAFYDRTGSSSAAIISFSRYRNRPGGVHNFGNSYEGDVFFAEYYQGFVRRIRFDGRQWQPAAPVPGQPSATDWAQGVSLASDARVGSDGALYYVKQFPGQIRRIVYTPKLPAIVAADTARAGLPFQVRSLRDPGDFVLVVMGLARIPPTPLRGFFGRVEVAGSPIAAGAADAQGGFDVNFPPVPAAAVGLTVHFQSLSVAGVENFISPPRSVQVIR